MMNTAPNYGVMLRVVVIVAVIAGLIIVRRTVDEARLRLNGLQRAVAVSKTSSHSHSRVEERTKPDGKAEDRAYLLRKTDNAIEAGNQFLAKNPDVRRLSQKMHCSFIAGRYYPLYASLGLSPDQMDRFEEIMSTGLTDTALGPNGDRMKLRTGSVTEEGARKNELIALLGEHGYGEFERYNDGAASLAASIISASSQNGELMSPAQTEELAAVVRRSWPKAPGEDTASLWDKICADAPTFLSGRQVSVLQRMRKETELKSAAKVNRSLP